jgi:hypothetical protein
MGMAFRGAVLVGRPQDWVHFEMGQIDKLANIKIGEMKYYGIFKSKDPGIVELFFDLKTMDGAVAKPPTVGGGGD